MIFHQPFWLTLMGNITFHWPFRLALDLQTHALLYLNSL